MQEQERPILLGRYIVTTGATVRKTGYEFCISKSTVHKDITEKLFLLDPPLARQVRVILDRNKAERHIRGGLATKRHFEEVRDLHEKSGTDHRTAL